MKCPAKSPIQYLREEEKDPNLSKDEGNGIGRLPEAGVEEVGKCGVGE